MKLLLITLFSVSLCSAKPNLLIILADDMGYGDLGCFGSKQIETPHLDQLAKGGIRCSQGYVSGNVCSPSRAGLLTGRYQQRFGFEHNLNRAFPTLPERLGIPAEEKTIADHLKSSGYRTGIVGKWHVGDSMPEMLPNARGFDFFFGMHSGSHNYFPTPGKHQLLRNGQKVSEIREPYLTDWFTSEALDFMTESESEDPWFLFLSYNTPHTPMQAKKEDLERFQHIPHTGRRTYAAMQWCMDQNIGRIVEELKKSEQLENTLIVFFSDNGGRVTGTFACNAPLRGMKGSFLEGGIRVPYIWHWPGGLPAGQEFDSPFIALDLLPTFMAAAGQEMPPRTTTRQNRTRVEWDGVNLLPYLRGEQTDPPHERLFWRMTMRGAAVREGDWKLLLNVHTPPALYDLANDVSEQNNLYGEHPEIVERLWGELNTWEESLEDVPHWLESSYWQGYNRKLYQSNYWLTQPQRSADYRGLKQTKQN